MAYRQSRNIEATLIDYITDCLNEDGWRGIRVEKSFSEVYEGELPCICINTLDIRPEKLEIGGKKYIKYYTVNIRIFATSDGIRLDLSDWLFEKLEDVLDYYQYTITNGTVTSKDLFGKIIITRWTTNAKELTNTENLSQEDRYRHLLTFECYVAEQETSC